MVEGQRGQDGGVSTADWTLVIPVKPLATAKSRLRGAVPGVGHERLVLALALDTVEAARECAEVCLVCDDPAVGREAAALGARVLPDEPQAGLNAALRHGARLFTKRWVGALAADLPALRSAEIRAVLEAGLEK
jgi:2-phospho-L-lactate/phosphoenolpyruvate guanylyltransferase